MKTDKRPGRIPELDGLRVAMIFIVSWYHIWQQSWLTPVISLPSAGIWISLDSLLRSGYVWVDGTVLLSAFLLYLPLARKGLRQLPDTGEFLRRKARRILPGYYFIILVFFFGMCLPWGPVPRERALHGEGPVHPPDPDLPLLEGYLYLYAPGRGKLDAVHCRAGLPAVPAAGAGAARKTGVTLGLMAPAPSASGPGAHGG